MPASQPYRTPDRTSSGSGHAPADGLQSALSAALAFVVVWSLLRVAICSIRGLDLEGLVALAIVVAAVRSLTSRSQFP
jgi:hypothetical protein